MILDSVFSFFIVVFSCFFLFIFFYCSGTKRSHLRGRKIIRVLGVSRSFIKFKPHFVICLFIFILILIIRRRKVREVWASEISKPVPLFNQHTFKSCSFIISAAISALESEPEQAFLSFYDATKFKAMFLLLLLLFWYLHTVQKNDIDSKAPNENMINWLHK